MRGASGKFYEPYFLYGENNFLRGNEAGEVILLNRKELDGEDEGGAARNRTKAAVAIRLIRWNHKDALTPYFHTNQTFIPAFNDLSASDFEIKRIASFLGVIKLSSVLKRTDVMH